MYTIDLQDDELQVFSQDKLSEVISNHDIVEIFIPLPSINRTSSPLDIVQDYLEASYVVEFFAQGFNCLSLKLEWVNTYFPRYALQLTKFEPSLLANHILNICPVFQNTEDEKYYDLRQTMLEKILEYEEILQEYPLKFPEIIDDYFANLINGVYCSDGYEEAYAEDLKNFPERQYGYWRSAYYNGEANKVYISRDAWIVPHEVGLIPAFKRFGYGVDCSVIHAELLTINSQAVAISEGVAIALPFGKIIQALACLDEVTRPKDDFQHRLTWEGVLFPHPPSVEAIFEKYASSNRNQPTGLKIFTSEFSDFVIINTHCADIVIFDIRPLNKKDAERYISATRQLISAFEDEVISPPGISLPWMLLDDEKFEQLCYDIIYHNSKYDRGTIRKMGKSRSRDGGRDIVVYTKPRVGEKPLKYIFQCKLYKPECSANTSNVNNISDTIDQFHADGYGIMCSCHIDSSLYDRLDGISSRRGIEVETWSIFEIERFLARRPSIKSRYF